MGEDERRSIAGPAPGRRLSSIYVRDTRLDVTTRLSTGINGSVPDGASYHPSISADGQYVAFASEATNLIRGGGSRTAQIYVHERATGEVELASRSRDGRPGDATAASQHSPATASPSPSGLSRRT